MKCWPRPPPSAAACSRPARAPTKSPWSRVPRTGSGPTGGFASPAPPARNSPPGRWDRSELSRGNERGLGSDQEGVRETAGAVLEVLRLRHVSRRRAQLRAQPVGPALRLDSSGRDPHRALPLLGSGDGEARRRLAGGLPQGGDGASLRSKARPAGLSGCGRPLRGAANLGDPCVLRGGGRSLRPPLSFPASMPTKPTAPPPRTRFPPSRPPPPHVRAPTRMP